MSKFYTEEMRQYLLKNYKGKTARQIQEEFNCKFNTNVTYHAIKSYLGKNNIKLGRNNNRKFRDVHIQFLKENVKGITLKELTNRFNKAFNMNVSESAISNLKAKYNLQSGIVGGQFVKGQTSFNKGKKWCEYMSEEGQKNSRKTTFKKGNIPANRRPIGSERINKRDGVLIKVRDGHKTRNWMPKSRYIYEQAHGKIPEGHKVIFADGNNRNFDLDNLVLVSNAEELIMNQRGLFSENAEFTKTGANIAKVLNKAKTR